MTRTPFRRITQLLLAALALTLAASGGCSRMSEGERCDFENAGDQDCDDGLECVQAMFLPNGSGADRCCPPENQSPGDQNCVRGNLIVPSTGGSSGAGGTTGGSASGAAGESTAGGGGSPGGGEGGQPPSGMAGDGGGGMSAAGAGGV